MVFGPVLVLNTILFMTFSANIVSLIWVVYSDREILSFFVLLQVTNKHKMCLRTLDPFSAGHSLDLTSQLLIEPGVLYAVVSDKEEFLASNVAGSKLRHSLNLLYLTSHFHSIRASSKGSTVLLILAFSSRRIYGDIFRSRINKETDGASVYAKNIQWLSHALSLSHTREAFITGWSAATLHIIWGDKMNVILENYVVYEPPHVSPGQTRRPAILWFCFQ